MSNLTVINEKQLFQAAINNDIILIEQFHMNSPHIHWNKLLQRKTRSTLLHHAAQNGNLKIVKYLIQNYTPKDINFSDKDSKTALHEAAQACHASVVEYLLKEGADVDALKRGDWTPLMCACASNNQGNMYKTVSILVETGGADIHAQNKDGWNPFLLAVRSGILKVVKYLINVDPSIVQSKSTNGRTALHIACLHGHMAIIKEIISKFKNTLDLNQKCSAGNTCFHDAIYNGNLNIIDYLIEQGVDTTLVNGVGFSCLHLAAYAGHCPLIEYLMDDLKFPPNCRTQDKHKMTPLHCAAVSKKREAMLLLIKLGCDPNLKDGYKRLASAYYEIE